MRLSLTSYDRIHLVGRVLSALLDLGSVLLLFILARRLCDCPRANCTSAAEPATWAVPPSNSGGGVAEGMVDGAELDGRFPCMWNQ
jgi:hypothetical protein